MAKGILGRKVGMTQVFSATGTLIPVTVIEVTPNVVLQKKTVETDGYNAVQLGFVDLTKNANKAETGHAAKAQTAPKRFVSEIAGDEMLAFNVGQEIKGNIFANGELVDVTGTSKGKGTQGGIKRYGHKRGPMAHGSGYHRGAGSMGPRIGSIRKGKEMPGHMGSETATMQNLELVKFDAEKNVILVKGNVPGAKNSLVIVTNAVKAHNPAINPEALA